jgi:ribulose kinase
MKTCFAAVVLGGFLLLGSGVPSVAAAKCEKRVHKAEQKLKKQSDRHGEQSRQTEQARRTLLKERTYCHAHKQDDS